MKPLHIKSKTLSDFDFEILETEQGIRRTNGLVAAMGIALPMAILASTLLFAVPSCNRTAEAAEIPESTAVRAIIGEASNQGYKGMLAVACALRNRGTIKGVYGVKAKHVDNQPKWVWDMAKKAWRESAKKDCTNGATHWENTKAFGKPYWAKNMVVSYKCKDHVFYKEKSKS